MNPQFHTFSQVALEQAENQKYYGRSETYNGHARVTGPCGDTMEYWIFIQEQKIQSISFITDGCASSRACGSMTATLADQLDLSKASALTQQDILDTLGEFPDSSTHCALLATDTLRAAILDYKNRIKLMRIKNKIVVMSGKGGVGKSTIAANMAQSLQLKGFQVGLLDVDIHGPSIPTLLGLTNVTLEQGESGLKPILTKGLKVMSAGFLLQNADDAVVWRGPRKHSVIKQFFTNVEWEDLDYLIIDSPPGTGDELMSVFQMAGEITGTIVVTTPQKIAASDVRKSVTYCQQSNIPILGIVENMNGFACPHCGEVTDIFPIGAGKQIANDMNIPYLGSIPMDRRIAQSADDGVPLSSIVKEDPISKIIYQIIQNLNKES